MTKTLRVLTCMALLALLGQLAKADDGPSIPGLNDGQPPEAASGSGDGDALVPVERRPEVQRFAPQRRFNPQNPPVSSGSAPSSRRQASPSEPLSSPPEAPPRQEPSRMKSLFEGNKPQRTESTPAADASPKAKQPSLWQRSGLPGSKRPEAPQSPGASSARSQSTRQAAKTPPAPRTAQPQVSKAKAKPEAKPAQRNPLWGNAPSGRQAKKPANPGTTQKPQPPANLWSPR